MPAELGGLTDTEVRLAEPYVRVLDLVSRCAHAMDAGNWHYLFHKAAQLQDAATALAKVAGQTWQEIDDGGPRPRTEAMRAAVAEFGHHYRAGRLLHPMEPGRQVGER